MTFSVELKEKLDRFAQNNDVTKFAGYKIVRLRIVPDKKYVAGKLLLDIAKVYQDETLKKLTEDVKKAINRKRDLHVSYQELCDEVKNKAPLLLIITNFYEEIGTMGEEDVNRLFYMLRTCQNLRLWICAKRGWYKDKKSIYQELHQQFEAVPVELFDAIQRVETPPYTYFSYSWEPKSDDAVNSLSDMARLSQLPYRRDKDHCGYRANITKFMDKIRAGRFVVVIFSEEYLKSYYCMYELTGVMEHQNYEERLFPIVMDDGIREDAFLYELEEYWKEKQADANYLSTIACADGVNLMQAQKKEILDHIVDKISTIQLYIKTINELSYASHVKGGYTTIMEAIIDKISSRI